MLKQQLVQKLQQRLSPQQIQLMRLLEYPSLELGARVSHELEVNPALEIGNNEDSSLPSDDENLNQNDNAVSEEEEFSLGDYGTEDDIPEYKLRSRDQRLEKKEQIPFSVGESLGEYLLSQIGVMDWENEEQQEAARFLVGNIEADGYLRRDLQSLLDDLLIYENLNLSSDELLKVLKRIKRLDPIGVGAADLKECLLLQLRYKEQTKAVKEAIQVLEQSFDDFAKKRFDKILRFHHLEEDDLRDVIHEVSVLNPRPGSEWGIAQGIASTQITPDFVVEAIGDNLFLSVEGNEMPPLRVNKQYVEMVEDYNGHKANRNKENRDAIRFVKTKIESAYGFIEAVRQRQETLRRTMTVIMEMQRDFFFSGEESDLRPMVLRDVAEKAGYDISTISRVSNSKYVQTNFGIYPLKYFFSISLPSDSQNETSTREIKSVLAHIIEGEDKRKPLADEALTRMLNEKGYQIARRTVAKYREQLDVPVARLRKEL